MVNRLKSTAFFVFISVVALVIVGHNFERYYIVKDYPVNVFTVCDPLEHSCFKDDLDTADPTFQTGPYAKVEIAAAYAPSCLDEHTCSHFSCDGIKGACSVTYCSEESKEEGETCSDNK